jgi:hypothetical protein
MLFELLAAFAQESVCQIIKNPRGATAVIHREDQQNALLLLSKIQDIFECTMNSKLLGVELCASIQLLTNAIQSYSIALSNFSITRPVQRTLQAMGFELLFALGSAAAGEFADCIRHACNIAILMMAETAMCVSNDWMTIVIEMNIASLGCLHEDYDKAHSSFLTLQRYLSKYTSFLKRRCSLLLQAVAALYKVARASPHPSIRLLAAIGHNDADSQDSVRNSPQLPLIPLPALEPGDSVVLQRSDGGQSTRLRKLPSKARDASVWVFPTQMTTRVIMRLRFSSKCHPQDLRIPANCLRSFESNQSFRRLQKFQARKTSCILWRVMFN